MPSSPTRCWLPPDAASEAAEPPRAIAHRQDRSSSTTTRPIRPWRRGARSAARRGYRSSIACPLFTAQQAFGVLSIYAPDPGAFSAAEVALLEELASNLSFGIATLRTRAENEQADGAPAPTAAPAGRERSALPRVARKPAHRGRGPCAGHPDHLQQSSAHPSCSACPRTRCSGKAGARSGLALHRRTRRRRGGRRIPGQPRARHAQTAAGAAAGREAGAGERRHLAAGGRLSRFRRRRQAQADRRQLRRHQRAQEGRGKGPPHGASSTS